jgi:arylacetamide deacetylase
MARSRSPIAFRYRLAPEHRFPSALNDCLSVCRELFANETEYGINAQRIILSGDSAGGNLALVVGHLLIDDGYRPYLISLLYPSLQFLDFTLPSYRLYLKRNILGVLNEDNLVSMIRLMSDKDTHVTSDILLSSHTSRADKNDLYRYMDPSRYLSISHQLTHTKQENESVISDLKYLISPLMSPLLVSDQQLLGLPQVLLFTTEFDILRDEGSNVIVRRTSSHMFRSSFARLYLCRSITFVKQKHLSSSF